jgi:uncharacterized protein YkwD
MFGSDSGIPRMEAAGAEPLNRLSPSKLLGVAILIGSLSATAPARADTLAAVQILREGGCGGLLPQVARVRHNALLDLAAEQWAAAGVAPATAAERSGYEARTVAGLHISGRESSTLQLLRRSACRTVMDQHLQDLGVYHRGLDTWIVLASAYNVPTQSRTAVIAEPARAPTGAEPTNTSGLAERALQLVNEVRSRGTRCGERTFGPAPPMRLSGTLADVAIGHANDMAEHNYFEHVDPAGRSPADRVRAVGYREKLVGENIAYGPQSVDEVVRGWLDSPGHCENIMDPRFAEMGLAFAAGQSSRRGLFWVQLMAAPRA